MPDSEHPGANTLPLFWRGGRGGSKASACQLTHRDLIATYLFAWDNRPRHTVELGACATQLRVLGYDPCNIEELRERIA